MFNIKEEVARQLDEEINDRDDDGPSATLAFDEFAGDSIVSWKYLRKSRKKWRLHEKFKDSAELAEHFDPVDPNLIAKLNVEETYEGAPTFAKESIKYALEENSKLIDKYNLKTSIKMIYNTKKIFEQMKQRKGVPRQKQVQNMVATAVSETLVGFNNLFRKQPELEAEYHQWKQAIQEAEAKSKQEDKMQQQEVKEEATANSKQEDKKQQQEADEQQNRELDMMMCFVNLFVVDKSSKKEQQGVAEEFWKYWQRIILDARMANCFLKNTARMEIFTLDALLQRVGYLMLRAANNKRCKIFATQADLRHFFHQIPIPRRYQRLLRMDLGKHGVVYPRAWPMGFHMSPGVAQGCTWGILLRHVEKNKFKIDELGIEWDADKPFDHYLQWLPLRDGGAVFVCIDNIFIISPNESHVKAWQQQIESAISKDACNAVLKEQDEKGNLFETKVFTHAERETTSIIFGGIEFFREGRRPKEAVDKVSLLERKDPSWSGTFRELAAIMGQCLWHYRVKGRSMLQLESFLDLYKFSFPSGCDGNGNKLTWDSKVPHMVINNSTFQQVLLEHYRYCRDNSEKVPYERERPQKSICFLTTDAAREEKATENNIGAMWSFSDDQDEQIPILDVSGVESHRSINRNRNEMIYSFKQPHTQPHIALAELEAVIVAIEKIKQQRQLPDIFMLAIDSMAAKGMLGRNFSKVKEARVLLKRLDELLDGRKLFLYWVASKLNPADAPSRSEDSFTNENILLFDDVVEELVGRLPAARTNWMWSGKNTSHDKRKQRSAEE